MNVHKTSTPHRKASEKTKEMRLKVQRSEGKIKDAKLWAQEDEVVEVAKKNGWNSPSAGKLKRGLE